MGEILTISFIFTGWYGVYKYTHRIPKVEYIDDHEPTNQEIRQSSRYRNFRIDVLKRDNFQCIWCKVTTNLEVHHWYSFNTFPDFRFDIKNAATLCYDCHKLTPNYGSKEKKFSQQIINSQ